MKAKRILISVIALCCTMVAWAQNNQSLTAILQHVVDGTETAKVYVGKEAFKNAYNDAVNGDVITLSSGSFDSPSVFQKELSVYGAGYEEDAASGTAVTNISSIEIKDIESLSNLHFEGLRISSDITCRVPITNMVISKCFCQHVYFHGDGALYTDITIQQCVITLGVGGYSFNSGYITKANNLIIKNCILGGASIFDPSSTAQIDHCLLLGQTNNTNASVYPFWYTNCVFGRRGAVQVVGTLENCIIPWGNGGHEINLIKRDDKIFSDSDDGWASDYSATRTYELLLPEVWIGNDGSQIGIHGGMGFSKVPSTPVIKNMTVTPEGKKIKVNYETNVR